jgi:hypothetical protein
MIGLKISAEVPFRAFANDAVSPTVVSSSLLLASLLDQGVAASHLSPKENSLKLPITINELIRIPL